MSVPWATRQLTHRPSSACPFYEILHSQSDIMGQHSVHPALSSAWCQDSYIMVFLGLLQVVSSLTKSGVHTAALVWNMEAHCEYGIA